MNEPAVALVVYNYPPEYTHYFLIPMELYMKHEALIEEAHGKCINYEDENPGMEFMKCAVQDPSSEHSTPDAYPNREALGVFWPYKVDISKPLWGNIKVVTETGFGL